jgi:hypothetical protein
MNHIIYSRFNISDLHNIKNNSNFNIILQKLNINKYIDISKNNFLIDNNELIKIINNIHIFQSFTYFYKESCYTNFKVYFLSDNLPTIEDIYNKNYNVIYLEFDLSLIEDNDYRIKDFELWLEKIIYYKDIFGSDFFYKNDTYKNNSSTITNNQMLVFIIKKYLTSLKIDDNNDKDNNEHNNEKKYIHAKISIQYTGKTIYIKYKDDIEFVKKVGLNLIDEYPNLFIKDIKFNVDLFIQLYNKLIKQPFIIEKFKII